MHSGALDDKLKEACGVFGIYAPDEDVARRSYFALYSLQHRGQESAGIAVSSGKNISCYKKMGLVSQVFNEEILRLLKGRMAIGHVRYSTTGASTEANAHPVLAGNGAKRSTAEYLREVAVAHNGNLVNTAELRADMERRGISFSSTSDTEVIAEMIAMEPAATSEDAVAAVLPRLKGVFSLAILCEDKLIAARDPFGIRPLCIGRMSDGRYAAASETCAFNIIGAKFEREVLPGEMIIISESGMESRIYTEAPREAMCIFEFIYFARPDSIMHGQRLYTCRKNMGRKIYEESPVEADVVISVPDSGTPAAIGYAAAAGIPFEDGLIKNRYVGRTFIQPDQQMRELGVKIKLCPLEDNIRGKRIVVVDDSIVRGNTSSQIIAMLYDAGAKEVHMRVSCPPLKFPCFYGIDMATRKELLASSHSVEQIRQKLGCDSLAYLSIEGMIEAAGGVNKFCLACFNEDYPIPLPQQLPLDKLQFENSNSK